jgi:hypothetical protein
VIEIDIEAEKAAHATRCTDCDEPTEGLYQIEVKEKYVGEDGEEKERMVTLPFCSNDCAVKYAIRKKDDEVDDKADTDPAPA